MSGKIAIRGPHPSLVRDNYLASPPLLVGRTYALAGAGPDLTTEALGTDKQASPLSARNLAHAQEVEITFDAAVSNEQ